MTLKIKDSVKGQIITRSFIGRGAMVIDTNKEFSQAHMKNLYDGGFSDLFEYVAPVVEEKEEEKESLADELTDLEKAKEEVKNYSKKKK